MQKRIIAITLSVTLVLCSSVSVFAANGETVAPVSSTGTMNYYNGTSSNGATNVTISTWGHLVTYLTDAFARSIRSLANVISTASNNEITSIDNVWTRLGVILSSVDQIEGYIDGLEGGITTVYTYLGDIKGYTDQIETKIETSNTSLSNIYNLLQQGGLVDEVKIKDNASNGFSQAYFWAKWLKGSSVQLNTINANGDLNASNRFDFGSNSILGGIEAILYYYGNGLVTSASRITQHVVDTSYATDDYLYDTDLVGTNMAKDSLWANVRDIGSNLSMHLSRLDYVLASDDEIAARQAAEDNQNAFVDNFLDGSGSGSASTSDLGDMADGSAAIKAAFSSNASATDAFNILSGDGDVWDWFTQGTKDSFDNVANTRSSAEYTNYYQAYMDQVYKGVNEDNDSR